MTDARPHGRGGWLRQRPRKICSQAKTLTSHCRCSAAGVTSYYQNDGVGSIDFSQQSQQRALANTYTFDSFGNMTASTGTITNPFQYTGREFDTETGLYFYRARYFDPASGTVRQRGSASFWRRWAKLLRLRQQRSD